MKKCRTMRLASAMLVLTLLSTCMISGTFAKYTTQSTGTDTARVAKFGVELTAETDLFQAEYKNSSSEVSVKTSASPADDVIAPGTTGTATIFTISGTPEVDVKVTVSLSGDSTNPADDLTMVTLPADNYKDYTDLSNDTPVAVAEYKPVKWTLSKDAAPVAGCENVNLDVIENYFASTLSGKYDVETGAGLKSLSAITGTYTLTWNWDFDASGAGTNDVADTFMGQIAAGVVAAPAGYVANESFNFVIQVTQID